MPRAADLRLIAEHFSELYRNRALIASLAWRDVVARYKRSLLGFLWTLANPLMSLAVYGFIFTQVARSVEVPNFAVFAFAGILPWTWLSGAVTSGATSITGGGALITRICIPPQVLPAIAVLANLVNFAFALPVAVLAAAACGIAPGPALLFLPLLVLIELVFAYAVAVLLAALTVRFRDVPFILQNTIGLWFVLTPIVYPIAAVPEALRPLYAANPATSVILPFVDVIYHARAPGARMLAVSVAWSLVLLLVGVRVFEAMRDGFAEEV